MGEPRIQALGDAALLVTVGDAFSEDVNARVMRVAASLGERPLEVRASDIVPGICSLAVHFDGPAPLDRLAAQIADRIEALPEGVVADESPRAVREIRVRYGGDEGPDLEDVAAFARVSAADVIETHASRIYRVYMLGFLPGFAYLGQVDASIAAPRRSSPRQAVPAGSVGIAGLQTGVYPQVSPGGWQLIGRTSARMFDTVSGRSLLGPGDSVRFVPERA